MRGCSVFHGQEARRCELDCGHFKGESDGPRTEIKMKELNKALTSASSLEGPEDVRGRTQGSRASVALIWRDTTAAMKRTGKPLPVWIITIHNNKTISVSMPR